MVVTTGTDKNVFRKLVGKTTVCRKETNIQIELKDNANATLLSNGTEK